MRYFTSDSHLGHENILHLGEGRPFRTLSHMHSIILNNCYQLINPEVDDLYHLGDGAMGNFSDTIKLLASLPGRNKFFIPGNHDKIFPKLNTKARIEHYTPEYEKAGYKVLPLHPTIEIMVDGIPVTVRLSHLPYSPERFPGRSDKLAFARPVDDGMPLVHGHTHSRSPIGDLPYEYHVGVDAHNFMPVPETEIVNWLRTII